MGRIRFKYQKPADGVYRVGTDAQFTTIQAAINQAETDGYTTAANKARIEIYAGTYNENLTLKKGMDLYGFGAVVINGNATYAPIGGTRSENTILFYDLTFKVVNGVTMTLAGTGQAQMHFNACFLEKSVGGDVNPVLLISNTNGSENVRVRFYYRSFILADVAGINVIDQTQTSRVEFDHGSGVFSATNVQVASCVRLNQSANFRVYNCPTWNIALKSTNAIEIITATASVDFQHSGLYNSQNTGNGVFYTNATAANARFRWCVFQIQADTGGYIAKGTNGNFVHTNSVFFGTNHQIQNTINIQSDAISPVSVP